MTASSLDMTQYSPVYRSTLGELAQRGAPPCARFAFISLRSFARVVGDWWRVRHKTLATVAGIAYSSLRRGLQWLDEAGIIETRGTKHADGGQGANEYRILWWPEALAKKPKPPSPKPDKPSRGVLGVLDSDGLSGFLGDCVEEWGKQANEHAEEQHEQHVDAARMLLEAIEAGDMSWQAGHQETKRAHELVNGTAQLEVINPWHELRKGNRSLSDWIAGHVQAHPMWSGTRKNKIGEALRALWEARR